ncbi:unnamed protein product [Schistosoma margrebowiei]|uniref:Uncharacterized protein n=1 Tax=Schistosoma margrebowiei TaxID=48269 RepID=A0A183LPB0_9TREM|nr:unnamed protein product [Schistosoma margrebowiei]
MKSSRPKEKRKTKEHITPRNGNRHEKDGQELDGIRKEGPGQSGFIKKNWTTGETAIQRTVTASKDLLKGEEPIMENNFDVLGGCGSQQASS